MSKEDKIKIFKSFERIEKKVNLLNPTANLPKTATIIHPSGLYKGKRWNFKYPPKNVLEIAKDYMKYDFLSDNQKKVLVELFGLDPEEWNLDYQEIIMLVGQGGGKNTVTEVACGYALQYLINLENPYKTFSKLCKKSIPLTSDFEFTNNSMVGECVPLDSEILTKNGFKYFDKVKPGELVLTYSLSKKKLEWKPVQKISVFYMPTEKYYNDEISFRCTSNHKWVMVNKNKKQLLDNIINSDEYQILTSVPGEIWNEEKIIPVNSLKAKSFGYEKVWCPTTANGTWIMRQNNFIAITGNSQAKSVFFDHIKKVLKIMKNPRTGENIFQKYGGMDLRDEGLGDIKAKVIEFPAFFPDSGRIRLHSLDSGISTFEGKTIFMSFMDEPSRANTESTYKNAKTLYRGLMGNLNTRFPNGVGKLLAFSYPNTSEYDLTYELATGNVLGRDEGEKVKIPSTRKIYIFSTFDFNPCVKRTNPEIQSAYENDPDDSRARYECIKFRSQNAFFQPHLEKILECVIKNLHNRVTYEICPSETIVQGKKINKMAVNITQIKGDNKYRAWAMDTSINKDRFVLVSGYSDNLEKSYNTSFDYANESITNKKVIIDLIIVWKPSKSLPVDYKNVSDVIEMLLDAYPNSVSFAADKYQSQSIATIFEGRGITTNLQTFSRVNQMKLYTQFRTAIFNNLVGYIDHPLLIEELQRVQKKDETKIDHPLGFSKDVADAVVQLYGELVGLEYSSISDSVGLDRFRDTKIIEMINRFVRAQNEAKMKNIADVKGYICERLNIPPDEYNQIETMKEVYFPNPK